MPSVSFPLPPSLVGRSLHGACCAPDVFVPFWRGVVAELTVAGISDYRLKIRPEAGGAAFSVSASTGKEHKTGPRSFALCLSCDPGKATIAENNFEGGEAGRGPPGGLPPYLRALTSGACEWSAEVDGVALPGFDSGLARVWLDAQARSLMIVTPRRHAGGMHEMDDAEVGELWAGVGAALALQAPTKPPPFAEVVLNVGRFRNIEHAHIKVWFDPADFLDRVTRWPAAKRQLQADLQELRRLMKIPSQAALLEAFAAEGAGSGGGAVELLVRGAFAGPADEEELRAAFGVHGAVLRVALYDPRFGVEGALVTMADAGAAAAAAAALNLTRLGRNVMCKVKPAAALLAARAAKGGGGP